MCKVWRGLVKGLGSYEKNGCKTCATATKRCCTLCTTVSKGCRGYESKGVLGNKERVLGYRLDSKQDNR